MKEKDADKLFLLMTLKNSKALQERGIQINIAEYEKYDVKSIEQLVREEKIIEDSERFDKLNDLLSGKGMVVDFGEEKTEDTLEYDQTKERENHISTDEINDEPQEKEEQKSTDIKEQFDEIPIVNSQKELNYISLKAIDKDGNDVEVVLEVKIEDGNITAINDIGELKEGEFIASDYFKSEIFDKLSEKSNVVTKINPKILEREFVPTTAEKLSEMTNDGQLEVGEEKDVAKKAIDASNNIDLPPNNNNELEEDKEEPEPELSEEDKNLAELMCEKTGRKMNTVKRALVIVDPKSVTDTLRNDGMKERGEKITVFELKSSEGNNQYVLVQGQCERIYDRREGDEEIYKLIKPIKKTEGVVQRVSDEETKVEIQDAEGKKEKVKVQAVPSDINQFKKDEMIQRVNKVVGEIQAIDKLDVDQFENRDDKSKAIDKKEMELYDIFKEYGIEPTVSVKTHAIETNEHTEIEEEENDKEMEEENSEEPRTRAGDAGFLERFNKNNNNN